MVIKYLIVIIFVVNFCLAEEIENAENGTFRRWITDKDRWAVLVSGSRGWQNYGDQANVCHAYKVLTGRGMRKENIITMMYDDVADHPRNPQKFHLKNGPNGDNVYEVIDIDYKSTDVTPEIFLKVLKGEKLEDKIGSSRVIESSPHTRIFVYFTGQGVPGALLFPETIMYAEQLNQALNDMHTKRSFGKMVLYIDAPYSGSLFEDFLPKNHQIMAATSSAPSQTAYKCYKDSRLSVSLGSYFSVNWMHDVEARGGLDRTYFRHQLNWISRHTTTSKITRYGDLRLLDTHLSEFMGTRWDQTKKFRACKSSADFMRAAKPADVKRATEPSPIPEKQHRGVNIMTKILRLMAKGDDDLMQNFLLETHRLNRSNVKCYESCVRHFSTKCTNIAQHPSVGKYLHAFINMCSSDKITLNQIREVIDKVCITD